METAHKIFFTKRRNLILFSLLILFYELGQVSFGYGPAPLGMVLRNPSAVNIFLHIALLYSFWRFMTAFSRLDTSKAAEEAVKKSIVLSMEKLAHSKVQHAATKTGREATSRFIMESATSLDQKKDDLTLSGASYNFVYTAQGGGQQNVVVTVNGASFWLIKLMHNFLHFFKGGFFVEYYFPLLLFSLALLESIQPGTTRPFFDLFNW